MSMAKPEPQTSGNPPRASLVLLGHNGAGKSTLIRYLLGFYPDQGGHPFLPHWQSIPKLDRALKIGYVPELPFLDPYLTGWEILHMQATLNQVRITRPQAAQLLERVGLSPEVLPRKTQTYSKGMKQRLMLAQACYHSPDILILDEPLSGLDPFGHRTIAQLLDEMKTTCQLILSTHSLQDAYRLGEQIWLLQNGQLVYQGDQPDSLEALHSLYFQYPPHDQSH